MKKRSILTMVAMVVLLAMPQLASANGRALVVVEERAVQQLISSSPQAKMAIAELIDVAPESLVKMDPAVRLEMLNHRLSGTGASQLALRSTVSNFFAAQKTSDISSSMALAEKSSVNRLPLPEAQPVVETAVQVNTNQLVADGVITEMEAQEFFTAVATTEVDGAGAVKCVRDWKPQNGGLYVRTVNAGARALKKGKEAISGVIQPMMNMLGITKLQATYRACVLAGKSSTVKCNAFGQAVAVSCL